MRTASRNLALSVTVLLAAFILAACGDTVENTTVNQLGMEVVATEDDLPECTEDSEGDQVFVKDEASARICVDGDWVAMNGSGSADFSCTTKELKDKSGLKIICNGDSIGVVLNGEKGEKGDAGENGKKGDKGDTGKSGEEGSGCTVTQTDSTITVVCGEDSTTIELGARETVDDSDAVSLDSLAGHSQKGPFLKGSTVYLYELDNGKTLKQTNGNFTSYITRDDGYYKFTARNLVSPYALVIVDGNYRNEVTGRISDQPIRLKALSDVRKHHKGANVNILTHLEYEYVYNLVTKQGMNFAAAKKQAQKDVFKAFDIELEEEEDAEVLDIFGKKEGDAALLALSVLLQGDRSEADMMVLLTEISNSIAEKGAWNDSVTKASLADWALQVDSEKGLETIRKHVQDWHLGGDTTVPDFMPHIRHFINVESHLGECGDKKNHVGTFAYVPNPKSEFFAHGYDSTDASRNSLARFVCDSMGGYHWRMATDLERDTRGWEAAEDGTVQMGQIDTSLVYVYDGGWRHGTEQERLLGLGCTQERLGAQIQDSDSVWYKCVNVSAWRPLDDLEREAAYFEEHKDTLGTLLTGPVSGRVVVWDAGTFRDANEMEKILGMGCVSYMLNRNYPFSGGLAFSCSREGWSNGWLYDTRDGINYGSYGVVLIGRQFWMASNLRNYYQVNGEPYGVNVERGVYYYTWAAAMDSAGVYSDSGKGCGYERYCRAPQNSAVRGICPEGWHLPSRDDWDILFAHVGGQLEAGFHLKSKTGWDNNGNGDNSYSFSASPEGYYGRLSSLMNRYDYRDVGSTAYFWSSSANKDYEAIALYLEAGETKAIMAEVDMRNALSVRCVKD